ncbi:MAG: hypothetical protein D6705_11830 [Deltaproteobacteria bacterium]|nr:MAG: hypothetical protein D6705_11830 [Deltaproteobacteria bacterium]
MQHRITHGLGDLTKARSVVEQAFSTYRERLADYEPNLAWQSDRRAEVTFRVMGKSMRVAMELDEQDVVVEGKLPLVFRPFQGKILGVLEREVKAWAERARTSADGDTPQG